MTQNIYLVCGLSSTLVLVLTWIVYKVLDKFDALGTSSYERIINVVAGPLAVYATWYKVTGDMGLEVTEDVNLLKLCILSALTSAVMYFGKKLIRKFLANIRYFFIK